MSDHLRWYFETTSLMGGVTGGAFGNILEASGLPAEVELAREAIQNSCDASAGQRPVLVRFKILHLTGDEKLRFMEVLQLLDGLGSRARELSLPEPNCLENGSERLQLTFIEDFETVGLSGDPHSPDSHFFRLLLELGDPAKTADVGTGGSYGFGKSALSLPSRLRTIVAYTLFNDAERGAVHRLMGCGYFRPHRHAGSHYTGRAWFAVPCNHDGENGYHPVEGIEAQQLARSLGFVERTSAGTSILVVDSQVDPDLLIEGIEDWWWPRLLDAKLQVEVEVDGASRHPRLRSNPRLAPFIQCYELAIGKSGPVGTHQKCAELNRLAGQDLGRCAFMYLEAHEEQRLAPSWADSRSASVALIREPRMVIEYWQPLPRARQPAVGVFVADKSVDTVLKLSEPPNHNRWDERSRRLSDKEQQIVSAILSRIKGQFSRFLKEGRPQSISGRNPLSFLERGIGQWLHVPSRRGADGAHPALPIEIRWQKQPRAVLKDTTSRTEGTLALRLRSDAAHAKASVEISVKAAIAELDSGVSGDETVPVTIQRLPDGTPLRSDGEAKLFATLDRDTWTKFRIQTAGYEPTWSVNLEVRVRGEA